MTIRLISASGITLALQFALKGKSVEPKTPFIFVNDEVMINFGDVIVYNYFDQNRFFVGVGYQFTKHLNAQVGYLNVFQQRASGNQFVHIDAIRFFVFHNLDFRKAFAGGASFLPEVGRHPNLVLMRTVSKLGLAGLRLGLAVGPGDWMAELEKVRLPYNVNVLRAAAAEFVLGEPGVLEEQTRAIVRDRARLEAGLDAIAGVERFPSAANFVLVRLPRAPRAFEALKSRGILVKNLHGSHPLLANCLRLTVGTPDENSRFLSALAESVG